MTTQKKIDVLSMILVAATVIGVGLDICMNWHDYGRGFIDSKNMVHGFGDRETWVVFLYCLSGLFFCVVAIIAFIRLVINNIGVLIIVRKGEIFIEELECRVKRIGLELILIFASELGLALVVGGTIKDWPGFEYLCCGIAMMIVSQIFALGRQIKEDQEYMV